VHFKRLKKCTFQWTKKTKKERPETKPHVSRCVKGKICQKEMVKNPRFVLLQKYWPRKSFLKRATNRFYGLLYYSSQVWLGSHTIVADIRKLNSVHYKLGRIVEIDWKKGKGDQTWIKLVEENWAYRQSMLWPILSWKAEHHPYTTHPWSKRPMQLRETQISYFSMMHLGLNLGNRNELAFIINRLDFNFHMNMSNNLIRESLKYCLIYVLFPEWPTHRRNFWQSRHWHLTTFLLK